MDSSLINAALNNRDIILSIIKKAQYSTKCNVRWRQLPEKSDDEFEYSAEDGGDMVSEFDTFTLYMVKSYSSFFNPLSQPHKYALVGLLVPPKYALYRVSTYREVLEAKASLDVIPQDGLFLFDGSIFPVVTWWAPRTSIKDGKRLSELIEVSQEKVGDVGIEYNKLMDMSLDHPQVPVILMDVALKRGEMEGKEEWYLALEIFEKLFVYKELIKKIWKRGSIPIYITKTSRSTKLCGLNLPDVHILKRLRPLKPGYVLWEDSLGIGVYDRIGEGAETMYPETGGIRDFYTKRLGILKIYARLSQGGSILQIEALFDASKGIPNAEEFSEEVLAKILSIPMQRGYPTPLVLAHHHAVITRRDMESIIKVSGLEGETREREMLVYF